MKSIADLPSPQETSISIVTPPKVSPVYPGRWIECAPDPGTPSVAPQVTLGILQQAKDLGIPAVWLQPGAEDDAVLAYIKENLADRAIYGGPCILVEGDSIAQSLKSSL